MMTITEKTSILAAKAFRHQVLNPADGVFLFHARAIERLIEEQPRYRQHQLSVPELPYYLMRREDFLFGLETENPEALSVIEGLKLPSYVILLPSPRTQGATKRDFRRLRHDYWARAFEAEVARSWQLARDRAADNPEFGALALRALVGAHADAELRAVLDHDGLTLPLWTPAEICRTFVARVMRLRYFAPGSRPYYFPALHDWSSLDRWLAGSGLETGSPFAADQLPTLLQKTRPGSGSGAPAPLPLVPGGLTRGDRDPDFLLAQQAIRDAADADRAPDRAPEPEILANQAQLAALEVECLKTLREASRLRRKAAPLLRLASSLSARLSRLFGRLLFSPVLEQLQRGPRQPPSGLWLRLRLALFRHALASASRDDMEGRFASALIHLADARRLLARLLPLPDTPTGELGERLAEHEALCERSLADELAGRLGLRLATAERLAGLVHRLAEAERGPSTSPAARSVLGHLEQVLHETRDDDYRLRIWSWLMHPGRRRIREILPFQAPLRRLRALQLARARLDELNWPLHELDARGQVLEAMREHLAARLEVQLMPRLQRALREADFVPRNHRERVAEHKMRRELFDVIRQRRHLKFTDVRDIVARNILRLPDSTLREFFQGDRLRRFDRTAARALPGVYRPGEFYIKGLQHLSAPLFGTRPGRVILQFALIPAGASYLVLKSTELLLHLLPQVSPGIHLANVLTVTATATLVNLVVNTDIGRHVLKSSWSGSRALFELLILDAPRRLLRWPPLAGLLSTGLARGIGRHLITPMLVGFLPLMPIIALAVLVEEVPIKPGFWLLGLAFALGTLARNTPAGRRFIDNLVTSAAQLQRRINQTLVLGLIQQLLYFFKEATRRIAQALHRVDEGLTHHLTEPAGALVFKLLAAPAWSLAEGFLQFYITVLVEPQVNPVKHFPIVTIGHKIMLPFLPAITTMMISVSESVLPKLLAYPLVTLTIVLLPGLFGFVVWELKENWKLYQANHTASLRGAAESEPEMALEPAIIGDHGETMRGILYRGFHSGVLPKAYDRVRRVIELQLRDQALYPRRVRACEKRLRAIERAVCVFVDRELSFALRDRCHQADCALSRIETQTPQLATDLIELRVSIYPNAMDSDERQETEGRAIEPIELQIEISRTPIGILMAARVLGQPGRIGHTCWKLIEEDLRVFAGRASARLVLIQPSGSAIIGRARDPGAVAPRRGAMPVAELKTKG